MGRCVARGRVSQVSLAVTRSQGSATVVAVSAEVAADDGAPGMVGLGTSGGGPGHPLPRV